MTYIETIKRGTKTYYYLTKNLRIDKNKWRKIRIYMGNKTPTKQEIKKHTIKIEERIKKENLTKSEFTYLNNEDSETLQDLRESYKNWVKNTPKSLKKKLYNDFVIRFTYNTNAIEGSKLNKNEVKELLEKDKWPDKSKEDIAEAYGVDEAIRFVRGTKEHISIKLIKEIHKIVFKNSKSFAGKTRKKGEDVIVMDNKGNIVHEGAQQSRINHLLKELILWYDKNKTKYPALILGAVVHNQFENIHPFRDGNGRVGRILLNNILLKHGLPPINIDFKNRIEYYNSLKAYELNKDLKPTIKLYIKEYQTHKKKLGDHKKRKK